MQFKSWFSNTEYMEMSDVHNMSTDSVHFEPMEENEFDEKEAEYNCELEANREDYGHYDDIYDDPHDDPDFDFDLPETWEAINPQPDPDDYENGSQDVSFKHDTEVWQKKKDAHAKEYELRVAAWEKDMNNRRYQAEEKESESRWNAIQDCVEKKRAEWAEENENSGGFLSKFKHSEDDFEVSMYRAKINYAGQDVPGSFKIEFTGPNGFNTTGKAGSEATAIYTKVLLAIKKLMTTQTVNGLTFEPAEPGMALVYQRFYDRFLKNEFVRISRNEAVRKSFINQIDAKLHPSDRQAAKAKADEAERETSGYLNQVKDNRIEERKMRLFGNAVMNKIVQMQDGSNIFVGRIFYDYENRKGMAEGITDQGGRVRGIKMPISEISQKPSDVLSGSKLLTTISQNQKWMKVIDQKAFSDLLRRYGVQLPNQVQ